MMTEHDRGFTKEKWIAYQVACAEASTPELLIVPGIEYSDPSNTIHILVWGCGEFFGENLGTSELLRRVNQHGGVAVFAHPSRLAAWKSFDPAWISCLLGIEVWNRKTDGWAPSRLALPLLENTGLVRFAGLDFHNRRQFFPMSMRCKIAGKVNAGSVLRGFCGENVFAYAFGRRIEHFLNPPALLALSVLERARRTLAVAAREFSRVRRGLA